MESLPRHLTTSPSRTTADDDDAFYRQDVPWRDLEAFRHNQGRLNTAPHDTNIVIRISNNNDGTGQAIIIGMLSAVGSAMALVIIFGVVYFLRFTSRGRILLDRIGRPGEYDDEQALAKEEADALEDMDDLQRTEYMRAKAFIQANPPETLPTDISLSQFLAIQEKGVSAWEFEPELEIANCFVEARTEIEFFDSECSVQSNLPIPKQNEVYYWEAKIYDKPESSLISIGLSTKPYPLFRLPGWHKCSLAYVSSGERRYNQPFRGTPYGPEYVQGDVIGVGYRPRTGSVFFTRNGKKLDDVAHGLKSQNFFPTIGSNSPCTVHVNFGQSGFVFIEANVKKWGLAPMTGSLAPPPPYGSEQGSILLETGRDGSRHPLRISSRQAQFITPQSPGPQRSPTEISLAQLAHIPSREDFGEGSSRGANEYQDSLPSPQPPSQSSQPPSPEQEYHPATVTHDLQEFAAPPPEYTSPSGSFAESRYLDDGVSSRRDEQSPLLQESGSDHEDDDDRPGSASPPIPSYEAAVQGTAARGGSNERDQR